MTLSFGTKSRISTVDIRTDRVSRIIKTLNLDKAHGHDNMSIRTLKVCRLPIIKPLCLLFNNCLRQGVPLTLISIPTYKFILQSSSSCIDLISTNQTFFVIDSGVHPSLHANCHLQLIYSKLNLKIEYPTAYEQLV